ncbi:MAG: DUF4926 domain-containing protein [Acidithiobacillus ferrivorans]
MIHKLEPVILVKDYPDQGLVKGDMGAVVLVQDGGKAFEVECIWDWPGISCVCGRAPTGR